MKKLLSFLVSLTIAINLFVPGLTSSIENNPTINSSLNTSGFKCVFVVYDISVKIANNLLNEQNSFPVPKEGKSSDKNTVKQQPHMPTAGFNLQSNTINLSITNNHSGNNAYSLLLHSVLVDKAGLGHHPPGMINCLFMLIFIMLMLYLQPRSAIDGYSSVISNIKAV